MRDMKNEKQHNQEYSAQQEAQVEKISLAMLVDDLWKGFKRFWLLLLILILVCSGGYYAKQKISYKEKYQSYATFVVVVSEAYGLSMDYYNRTTAAQLSKTFPDLLQSSELKTVVAEDLGTSGVPGTITAEVMENTALFTLRVEADDPQMSYDILQSVIKNYPKVAEFVIGESKMTMLDESGVPTHPSNPMNKKIPLRNGAAIGFVLSILFLFVYALTRKTVRTTDDMEKRVSLAYLGSVPLVKFKKRSGSSRVLMDSREHSNVLGDCFRSVRTRLLQEIESGKRRILVTSAMNSEGKTTIAVNIALALAMKNKKVVLIEGNLQRPALIEALGLNTPNAGLEAVLEGKNALGDAMLRYKNTLLHIIPAKEPVKDSAELLSNPRMQKMMMLLAKDYDYIIMDAPCNTSSDVNILGRYMDSAVLVVKQDYARMDKILSTIETIRDADLQAIGYVINATEVGITGYGYGYGTSYGYGYGYGYGQGYGYGYGYGKEKKSKKKDQTPVKKDAENLDNEFNDEA